MRKNWLSDLHTAGYAKAAAICFNLNDIEGKTKCPACNAENSFYQRDDDTEKVIRHRMEVYRSTTKPVLDYYEGNKVIYINGSDQIENITARYFIGTCTR